MTTIEKQDYDRLSEKKQKEYDFYSEQHPDWTHATVIKRIALAESISKALDGFGNDDNIDKNPKFQSAVFKAIDEWLRKFPAIHQQVMPFLKAAIEKMNYYIKKGIQVITSIYETIKELFTS